MVIGRRTWGAVAAAVAIAAPVTLASVVVRVSEHARSHTTRPSSVAWSSSVTRICAHALLFEGRHEIGTRAGAVAVSNDIRASTERRLRRVARLGAFSHRGGLRRRWIALERRLAAAYASSYVRIYEVIAAARTPRQHADEPRRLGALLHAPDRLSMAAVRLEQQLGVPDCTGGTPVVPSAARIPA